MSSRIVRFKAGTVEATAFLNDSSTADKVWEALPIASEASTWGDEIYFRAPIEAEEDDAQEVVSMGDVAFWPPGQALCLFFGPTPGSRAGMRSGRQVPSTSWAESRETRQSSSKWSPARL